MSSSTSASLPASTTAVMVPSSVSFVGSPDDAAIVQLALSISITDRLRDSLQADLAGSARLIAAFEKIAIQLQRIGNLLRPDQVPVTYEGLQASAKDRASLEKLFAADGPNLGDSLSQSNIEFEWLKEQGINLNAPIQVPVMTEEFKAIDGKIDVRTRPSSGSFSWYSQEDFSNIDLSKAKVGRYAGSVYIDVENRDADNKLLSVSRTTIFTDYKNRRTTASELGTAVNFFLQNAGPVLVQLEAALSQVATKSNALDERLASDEQRHESTLSGIENSRERLSSELRDSIKLIRLLRAQIDNSRIFAEKTADRSKPGQEDVDLVNPSDADEAALSLPYPLDRDPAGKWTSIDMQDRARSRKTTSFSRENNVPHDSALPRKDKLISENDFDQRGSIFKQTDQLSLNDNEAILKINQLSI